MTAPASNGYVLVLAYGDGSGLLGIWGPYPTKEDAEAGKQALQSWPLQYESWSIEPLNTPLAPNT